VTRLPFLLDLCSQFPGEEKITDFGSLRTARVRGAKCIQLTNVYMNPQQIRALPALINRATECEVLPC
jgi:hypothetical protein